MYKLVTIYQEIQDRASDCSAQLLWVEFTHKTILSDLEAYQTNL
jgi:hypothetical protein